MLVPAVGASASAQPADTGLGIRLVEAPSAARDDPRAQVYIVDHVQPATTLTRTIEVVNDQPDAHEVTLYAAAASLRDGQFSVEEGRAANELTSWIRVAPDRLQLDPRERGRAEVTITVPEGAAGGERYAAVLAELPPRPSDEPGVAVTSRAGIRVYLSVGSAEPPTSFRLDTFTPVREPDGRPGVDIHACNDGGRAVDLTGELQLSDGPGGTSAGPFSNTSGATTLAPGDCGDLAIRAPTDLPRGPWRARATLRSGETVESAEATVTFPDTAGKSAPVDAERVTESTAGRLAIVIALLFLVLALLLLFFLWRRRKRGEDDGGDMASASA